MVGDETVLLDLGSECYFGLDAVGTRVWQLLQQGASLAMVYECLLKEFAATPEQLHTDLIEFVHNLCETGLISAREEG